MLTPEQKLDLRTVIMDYSDALASGDNDKIADTAIALDATVCTMALDDLDAALFDLIEPTYADECDLDEAVEILDKALDRLA